MRSVEELKKIINQSNIFIEDKKEVCERLHELYGKKNNTKSLLRNKKLIEVDDYMVVRPIDVTADVETQDVNYFSQKISIPISSTYTITMKFTLPDSFKIEKLMKATQNGRVIIGLEE